MNNNMYNQAPVQNGVPQNMVQPPVQPTPQVMAQPVQPMVAPNQPVKNTPSAGAAMNNLKNTISGIDKDLAKKYIGMGAGVFILLSVFLPYMTVSSYGYSTSVSIWKGDAVVFKMLYLFLGFIPIITFFFQKAKSLSYLSAGFTLCYAIASFDAKESFTGLSIGFYLALIASIALLVLCVMEDLSEIKTMFSTKPKVTAGGTVSAPAMKVPIAAAQTAPVAPSVPMPPQGMPVSPAPMPQPVVTPSVIPNGPVQPVVQTVEVCNFCGQPKKNPMDTVCPSCGQRY